MKCAVVCLVPLLLASVACKRIQKVEYHEAGVEDEKAFSSSSLEEIPPREEWFKVKGDYPEQQQHSPKSITQEVYSLPASSRTPVRIVGDAFDSRRVGGGGGGSGGESEALLESERSRDNQMHISVRHRGRVGFQSNQDFGDDERGGPFHASVQPNTDDGDEWERITKVPPLSKLKSTGGRQPSQNWHLHIRHEGGRHDRGDVETSNNRAQTPREPEDQDFADEDTTRTRQNEPVTRQRDEQDTSFAREQDYESDGESSSRNSNNGRRVEALAIHNGDSMGRSRLVALKSVRGRNELAAANEHDYDDGGSESDRPPPHDQVARMARYIVHSSNWTSVATISTMDSIRGYPFVNIFSISDGLNGNSSGIPYMYLTPLDMSVIDLGRDSRASLTMSLAQSDYCRQQQYDPEDPRCAKVILSGSVVKVTNKPELQFAQIALLNNTNIVQQTPRHAELAQRSRLFLCKTQDRPHCRPRLLWRSQNCGTRRLF